MKKRLFKKKSSKDDNFVMNRGPLDRTEVTKIYFLSNAHNQLNSEVAKACVSCITEGFIKIIKTSSVHCPRLLNTLTSKQVKC
jgi:hypothetical protein